MVGFGYTLSKNCNQKPPLSNQSDLFMHFPAMICNGLVTTDGCNGQVFLYYSSNQVGV